MEELLKILFKGVIYKNESTVSIKTIGDLCNSVYNPNELIYIFAAINDAKLNYETVRILAIANEAYQEVCKNV